ncbi:MAG: HAD family hydrolase [Chloroflexota bacterium]
MIFDMDGVLVDTEPLHLRALNEVLAQAGCHLSEKENEQLLGTTFQATWEYLLKRFDLAEHVDRFAPEYDAAVLTFLSEPLSPAPGAKELLNTLTSRAVPLALASSAKREWIHTTLTSLGIRELFPIAVSGQDVNRGKPEPDIFLLAARQLGVDAVRCLVIEDSPNGITAGRRAGMDVLAVRTPGTAHLALEEATWIVSSLEEVNLETLGF